MDAIVIQEIGDDVNFKTLIEDKIELDKFNKLVDEHVLGYSQKRRLSEGLKEFVKKVEDAENRLIVARNVGKFKEPDPDDKALTTSCTSHELKAKLAALNEKVQAMIDESQITHFEKPHVLENLKQRLAKAKEAGKQKLEEKLDKMATSVVRALGFTLPVANLKEFFQMDKEIQAVEKLKKLNSKNLTFAIKDRIEKQADVQAEFDGLMDSSRQWFETVTEFKPRLQEALRDYAANEEALKKKEEEEAFEKKVAEENAALDAKRAAETKKEAELAAALEEKLKAKREEAALKPVKEQPKKQVKEKKVIARVDLQDMFQEELDYEEVSAAQIQADLEADAKKKEWAAAYKELAAAMKEAPKPKPKPPAAQPTASPAAEDKTAKAKSETSIAAEKEAKHQTEEEKFAAIDAKLAQKRLEAEAKPKKEAAPKKEAPKPKAKKMSLLDFYEEDDLLTRLAAQEAQEKEERAAAAEEAAAEAARVAAQAEAAEWAEEGDAWPTTQVVTSNLSLHAQAAKKIAEEKRLAEEAVKKDEPAEVQVVSDAKAAPAPKPPKLRKNPVQLENKWGAPVEAEQPYPEGEDDEELAELQETLVAGPSLAESLSGPKPVKKPPPQPKKKEKKKWGKVDVGLIGFDTDNPNLYA